MRTTTRPVVMRGYRPKPGARRRFPIHLGIRSGTNESTECRWSDSRREARRLLPLRSRSEPCRVPTSPSAFRRVRSTSPSCTPAMRPPGFRCHANQFPDAGSGSSALQQSPCDRAALRSRRHDDSRQGRHVSLHPVRIADGHRASSVISPVSVTWLLVKSTTMSIRSY
jgi:hypothetical protein